MKFKQDIPLLEFKKAFQNEAICLEYLTNVQWGGKKVKSPYHPKSQVFDMGNNTYKCKNTGKTFTAKTGTIFDNNVPLSTWFYAYYIVGRDPDIPHEQLGGLIGVKNDVSFSMLRLIKNSLKI